MVDQFVEQLQKKALSRRNFLAGIGVASAATLTGCGDSSSTLGITTTTPTAASVTDVDILNFALNLEYLETEFYLRAVTGTGIPSADGGGATVSVKASPKVTFSNSFYQQFAFELAQTELQHVRAIRATITSLGGTPVAAPQLDILTSFNSIGVQAGLASFDPYASDLNYFVGAGALEEVGVTAYTGAAKLITATAVLDAAAGIQAAEAYHAGAIRTILAASGSSSAVSNYNGVLGVLNKLDTAGHTTNLTIGNATTASSIVSADSNAIGFARTTDQVLHIAYATMAGNYATLGGFFPAGLNGTIRQPAS